MEPLHWLRQGDAVTQASALLLLAMSVASWVVMLYKLRLMQRARRDVARASAAFWQAPDWDSAQQQVAAFDRDALLLALVSSAKMIAASARIQRATADLSTLSTQASLGQQLTRVLRDALHAVLARLQFGQVLLATVGSTAPFVGLLGTVWGIYHALAALAGAGHVSIEQLAVLLEVREDGFCVHVECLCKKLPKKPATPKQPIRCNQSACRVPLKHLANPEGLIAELQIGGPART